MFFVYFLYIGNLQMISLSLRSEKKETKSGGGGGGGGGGAVIRMKG